MRATDVRSISLGNILVTFGLSVYSKYSLIDLSSTGPLKSILTSRRFPAYELLARGVVTTTDVRMLRMQYSASYQSHTITTVSAYYVGCGGVIISTIQWRRESFWLQGA